MKIGIIGNGVVGRATLHAYNGFDSHDVLCYDKDPKLSTCKLSDIQDCEIVFICTPELAVESTIIQLSNKGIINSLNIVIKSTTYVGSTQWLHNQYGNIHNIVHCPEFLTERTSLIDAAIPRCNIVGTPDFGENETKIRPIHPIYSLLQRRFPGVAILMMSSNESEFVKLALNAFFATKIAFFNELQSVARVLNPEVDWETVLTGMLADGRVTKHHTQVPGPDGSRGFGGKCLPKDLDTMISLMYNWKCDPKILEAVRARNMKDREGRK